MRAAYLQTRHTDWCGTPSNTVGCRTRTLKYMGETPREVDTVVASVLRHLVLHERKPGFKHGKPLPSLRGVFVEPDSAARPEPSNSLEVPESSKDTRISRSILRAGRRVQHPQLAREQGRVSREGTLVALTCRITSRSARTTIFPDNSGHDSRQMRSTL